ncbi:MAG: hypothetical protein ABIO60_06225, partial [Aquaticitalea sp.]
LLITSILFGQQQQEYINYQGVARDASNEVITSQSINIGISLRFGSPTAAIVYSETQVVTTDANGIFSLQIGTGIVTNGVYNSLEWGILAPYATITLNTIEVGTVQLQSVPYANASGKATKMELNDLTNVGGNPTNGQVLKWNGTFWNPGNDDSGTGGTTYTAGSGINIDGSNVISNTGDYDANPSNELQNLTLSGTTIGITNGTGVDIAAIIPAGGTDDQNLILTGDVLTIEGGTGSVDLSAYGNDADADPTNELQTLGFNSTTNELSLSGGNSVTIPTGGTDADADPTNELQTISKSGSIVTLSDGGGNFTDAVNDADADPTNEIDVTGQSGLLIGDGAVVTGLVGTADGQVPKWNGTAWVPGTDDTGSGGSSLWTENADGIFYNDGKVSIGGNSASEIKFDVTHNNDITTNKIGESSVVLNGSGRKTGFRAFVEQNGASADSYGFYSAMSGTNPGFGIYTIGEKMNYFSGNVGIGTIDSSNGKLSVMNLANSINNVNIYSEVSGTGNGDKTGYYSKIINGNGIKLGFESNIVNNSDLYSIGYRSNSSGTGTGYNFGIYTTGEDANYFSGKVGIGRNNPSTQLDITGGQWDLNNTEGDLRIGNNSYRLKMGMSLAGGGAGRAHIKAQGGINEISIGTGSTEVLKIKEDAIVVDGEVNRPSTGSSNLLPIAYGTVNSAGVILNGTKFNNIYNFTVEKGSEPGFYYIRMSGVTWSHSTYSIMATPICAGCTIGYSINESVDILYIYIVDRNNFNADFGFTFFVYKH